MKKRVLITGASGMLGASLTSFFSKDFDVFATGNSDFKSKFSHYKIFDLHKGNYKELIDWAMPDYIIHCAAITNGNLCSENPMLAFDVNGFSIHKLLDHTTEDTRIIYISTDAVFLIFSHLSKESDLTCVSNVYGKSKELGEFFLINSNR